MKILVISNLYPPHFIGGYELACRDVVEALQSRGHEVTVLTSTYGAGEEKIEKTIHRTLRMYSYRKPHKAAILYKEIVNQKYFRRLCADFMPDLIFVWNATNISASLAFLAKKMGFPVCYYVFDNWLATWEMDHWHQLWHHSNQFQKYIFKGIRLLFNLIEPHDELDLRNAVFASHYLKNVAAHVGKEVEQARVIHWGIDHGRFAMKKEIRQIPRNLLYVGQIVSQKGVHIAIHALDILINKFNCNSVSLTLVGDTSFMPEYVAHLQALARKAGVEEKISFRGKLTRDEITDIYADHDILIFPSVWDEPFGITQLEAMARGLAVVGSGTGGSLEILQHCHNALTFSRGDAHHCAEQILRLMRERDLYQTICNNGRKTVESKFSFDRLVNSLEEKLIEFSHSPDTSTRSSIQTHRGQDADARERNKGDSGYGDGMATLFQKGLSTAVLIVIYMITTVKKKISALLLKKDRHTSAMVQNILVVQLGDTGEAVYTPLVLSAIRHGRPSDNIILVVQPSVDTFLRMSRYADRTLYFDLKKIHHWKRATRGHLMWWLMALMLKVKLIRMGTLHAAISLHYTNDSYQAASAAILHLSGASQVIGYRERSDTFTGRVLNHCIDQGPIRRPFADEWERCSNVLGALGISGTDAGSDMRWHEDRTVTTRRHDSPRAASKTPIIALACGGEFPLRRWPVERFSEIGDWLQATYGARIVIIGDESDRDVTERCCSALRRNHRRNYVHSVNNVNDAVRLLKYCTLLVSNDTWQVYAAAATGTPVIGLFGPGDPARLGQESGRREVIRLDIPCSPCQDECMFERPYCMEGLQVERIKAAVAIMLRNFRDTPKKHYKA